MLNRQDTANAIEDTVIAELVETDLSRWHLDSSREGQVAWTYDTSMGREMGEQSFETKYWLSIQQQTPLPPDPKGNPLHAARNGFEFLKRLQSPDGHWSSEYGGPLFLTPGLIISCYVTKTVLPEEFKIELLRYLIHHQRQNHDVCDQGWGLNVSQKSTVLGTALNYVACRLLGLDAQVPMLARARNTLHALGGAACIPTWGKVWLSVLNVYDWEGINPTPPESWLLPSFLPFHPSRWWVHSRQVYIPMSYLAGRKAKAELDPLLKALRKELYIQPYEDIDWLSCRSLISETDLHSPHHPALKCAFIMLAYWEKICPQRLREMGLNHVHQLCRMEDENTDFIHLGPINKLFNLLVCWDRDGPGSKAFVRHQRGLGDYLWMTNKGMFMMATNGSQLWDLSFITQSAVESGIAETEDKSSQETLVKALGWLDKCQILENPKHYHNSHRHRTRGAWPFSTKKQSYTVSDCTAEALKSVMLLQQELNYTPKLVTKERLYMAIEVILGLQNSDGGFASYELTRGSKWLEWLNPSELFANAMIEYSYTECTTACLTAMSMFSKYHPEFRNSEIKQAIQSALKFVHSTQRKDGSWHGSWGVCFTYATMFGLESLSVNQENYENSTRAQKACKFLLDRQMVDGGWSERFESCAQKFYMQGTESQVVQTSWAILGLLAVKYPDHRPIKRACKLLMDKQKLSGDWEDHSIAGSSNETIIVTYPLFNFSWPICALGKAYKQFGDLLIDDGRTE
ncbi:Lanosterol synthase (Oxidosqualene--lanosterol cyclase) [Puccinia graminis f. sp. tritici]|uniref:Terpene cyclase/mutase family member n=1 Tax=Puccinia graminis f. sp. tritici TaxID=56615 RepID=A0A5B0S7N3_PUCGR|nr:Lanosterol synthase (Oxidosqualene--lanosterol cyclase) [Puccinia graminis f. sp. tritici]KAA1133445.1 Lanosterol synthase (Oxidosqualene--lanosterol cyclase) [Puccinia graminis f. sp. tritici]